MLLLARAGVVSLLLAGADGGESTEGRTLAPTPSGTHLHLKVGEKLVLHLPCVPQRFAVSASPYDLRMLGGKSVEVDALEKGKSTILAWCSNGERVSYPLTIDE